MSSLAAIHACGKFSSLVIAVPTSVGPIAASIFACGHSTTLTAGNMYSLLAAGASGDWQCSTVGRRYAHVPCSTSRGPYLSVSVRCLRIGEVAFDALPNCGGGAGHRERREAGLRIVGRQHFDRAEPLGQRLGDFVRVPRRVDARTIDAAAAAVAVDAFDHQVEILAPVVDALVAKQNLAEARAVDLHAGLPVYCCDGLRPAEDHAPATGRQHRPADSAPRRDRSEIASVGMPASIIAANMRYGVHGSCDPGLSTSPICSGITGSHSVCTPGEFDGNTAPSASALCLVAHRHAAAFSP